MKVLIVLAAVCTLAYGSYIRLSPSRLDGRMVGGKDTDIKDLPYQLSLKRNGVFMCSAAIISENWVLTAGSCVDKFSASEVSVRAGSNRRDQGGSVHQAKRIIVHPKYNFWRNDFDYALIEVTTPFTFGADVQAIKLADKEPQDGAVAIASGWGINSSSDVNLSTMLQSVELPIVGRDECERIYIHTGFSMNMMCAGELDVGDNGICMGDNGNPLVSGGVLVGISSEPWMTGCYDVPSIFANVANARPWIKEISDI